MSYLSASEVVFHEEALYEVYVPLPLPPGSTTLYKDDCDMVKGCMTVETDGLVVI